MAEERGIRDSLSWLIGSTSKTDFFERYHEQRALHCGHGDAARFAELLNIGRIDEIISSTDLKPASLSMARSQPPIKRSNYTFSNGNIDRGAVIRHFQCGATIILNQLHLADARLARFCRSLEDLLSCRVQTNVYLTPPGSQGFGTHYDDHDVFIVQVSGSKKWRLYERPVDNPYSGEGFKAGVHDPGKLEQEFLLQAGDCLYIPRGLMHDASSHGDEPSLHITTGLIVRKWADLMLEAVSEVALRNPKFRRSLPAGFARPDFDEESLEEQFRELAKEFAEQADFSEVLSFFRASFVRERRPELQGALVDASLPVSNADLYERRPSLQVLLRHDDSEVVIVCPGGNIHFEKEALPGLQAFLAGEPFSKADFSDLEEEKRTETIRRLSAFGLVRRVSQ